MKKFLAILLLITALVSVACFEEIYLNNFVTTLAEKSANLSITVNANEENLNVKAVKDSYTDLHNYWEKAKIPLCYFTNYEKIKSVDESFVKLLTGITHNDKSIVIENVAIIQGCEKMFDYILGFNINNLF